MAAGGDALETALGARIREVRRARDFTLRELASAVGVSESFVSQVERGVANPSMSSLTGIADALGVGLSTLFHGTGPSLSLVRLGERERLVRPSGSAADFLLTPPSARTLRVVYSIFAPADESRVEPSADSAEEEFLVVLDGRLDVRVDQETHQLEAGDALLLDSRVPHGFRNPGGSDTLALRITATPPALP